jgi:hypothetical protein
MASELCQKMWSRISRTYLRRNKVMVWRVLINDSDLMNSKVNHSKLVSNLHNIQKFQFLPQKEHRVTIIYIYISVC